MFKCGSDDLGEQAVYLCLRIAPTSESACGVRVLVSEWVMIRVGDLWVRITNRGITVGQGGRGSPRSSAGVAVGDLTGCPNQYINIDPTAPRVFEKS